jgi:AcrR family transcriptional regulator
MTNTPKRPRNAAATREAILQSALIAFSRAGYDGVGLREIAQEAGVTAILVNRYFGSKDDLFAAVVEIAFANDRLFPGDVATLSERVAHHIVAKTDKEGKSIDPFRLMLRSAPNVRAAAIIRKSIERHFERPLADFLSGDEIRARAALFLAVIAGFQLMRRIIASTALVEADEAALSNRLASLFQLLVDEAKAERISGSADMCGSCP